MLIKRDLINYSTHVSTLLEILVDLHSATRFPLIPVSTLLEILGLMCLVVVGC